MTDNNILPKNEEPKTLTSTREVINSVVLPLVKSGNKVSFKLPSSVSNSSLENVRHLLYRFLINSRTTLREKIEEEKREITQEEGEQLLKINALKEEVDYHFFDVVVETIKPEWIVSKGKYCGTFIKRLQKYFYERGVKLDATFLSSLGGVVGKESQQEEVTFDITDNFNWEDGDFGDRGSCYWGCREKAKDLLKDNKGLALRFFNKISEGLMSGRGRAWLVPTRENTLILFNGYGLDLLRQARILSTYLGLSYKSIELENNGSASGLLWINGTSYILGTLEEIKDFENYDFSWDESDYQSIECGYCGHLYPEEDMIYIESEDYHVCEDCLSMHYSYCEDCGNYFHNRDMEELDYSDSDGHSHCLTLCNSCKDSRMENLTECANCGDLFDSDSVTYIDSEDESYCESCLSDLDFQECEECNEKFKSEDMIEDDSYLYCLDCHERLVSDMREEIIKLVPLTLPKNEQDILTSDSLSDMEELKSDLENRIKNNG